MMHPQECVPTWPLSTRILAALALVATVPASARAQCYPQWGEGFELTAVSPNYSVYALTLFDDGGDGGPALYIGGEFSTVAGLPIQAVAKWDGRVVSGLEPDLVGSVYAIAIFDDGLGAGPGLYVGGYFTTDGGATNNYIGKWDGSAWSVVGGGTSSTVRAFAVVGDEFPGGAALYVGGAFTTAGGISASRVARWDGNSWSPLGSGLTGGSAYVFALAAFDDGSGPALYAGGTFQTAGGISANNIARWNGSSWSALGSGINGSVYTASVFDDASGSGPALFAGGYFTSAGGMQANRIAKWSGSAWSPLGTGTDGAVHSSAVFDGGTGLGPALVIGGDFNSAGGFSSPRIAQWDGSSWRPFVYGMSSTVRAIAAFADGTPGAAPLYVGGDFSSGGWVGASRFAKWDGAWGAVQMGQGVGGGSSVSISGFKVLSSGSEAVLYARGDFYSAGNIPSGKIAAWNGDSWLRVGGGISGPGDIRAIAHFDAGSGPELYVAGSFSSIGGVLANHIARWNGVSWSPLESGKNIPVNALAVYDDGSGAGEALYAAGEFFVAGGIPVNHIARWDGGIWTALGEVGGGPADGNVNALIVFDDGSGPALYVGGAFTYVSDSPIPYLARWNGSTWSNVGGPLNGPVTGLDILDDGTGPALYVKGTFSMVGGQPAKAIARWNGQQWERFAGGLGNSFNIVKAWAVFDHGDGPSLYATGDFTSIGGITANRIAKWNGSSWSSLGSFGLNGTGNALAVYNDGTGPALYVGGQFTVAGGLAARRIARWDGAEWSVVDIGLNSGVDHTGTAYVNALAVLEEGEGRGLYVGGLFETAGPEPSRNFARWTGCSTEACCLSGSSCTDLSETECAAQAGTPHGAGFSCSTIVPGIIEQPISQTACTETALILSVSGTGIPPLGYQWRKNGEAMTDGGNIQGSTTDALTVDPVGLADAGSYDVVVSNGCGLEISDVAIIAVVEPPRGHCDADTDVDLVDYAAFTSCWSGPEGIASTCECVDFDCDGNVDLVDMAGFQAAFGGGACGGGAVMLTAESADEAICVGEETAITASPLGGNGPYELAFLNTNGTLHPGEGLGAPGTSNLIVGSTCDSPEATVSYFAPTAEAASRVIEVVVTDAGGRTDSVQVPIEVGLPPSAAISTASLVTAGSTGNLASVADAGPYATYAWTVTGGVLSSGQGSAAISYFAGGGPTVSIGVSVTTATGCLSTAQVEIAVTGDLPPILFVSNYYANSVTSYLNPSGLNGNVAPNAWLRGGNTLLSLPSALTVNSNGDLLVSNFGGSSITAFSDAEQADGGTPPERVVAGPDTQLADPIAMTMNSAGELLFVANAYSNRIVVFAGTDQAGFSGNTAPARTIRTATSGQLSYPYGLSFGANDDLYVANHGGDNVLVFADASSLDGDVTPSRVIGGTAFQAIADVFVDADDILYVVDEWTPQVHVFDNASDLDGPSTPARTLITPGASGLAGIVVSSNKTGYITSSSANAVYFYDGIDILNGAIAPDRILQGGNTRLSGPRRVFLWE